MVSLKRICKNKLFNNFHISHTRHFDVPTEKMVPELRKSWVWKIMLLELLDIALSDKQASQMSQLFCQAQIDLIS